MASSSINLSISPGHSFRELEVALSNVASQRTVHQTDGLMPGLSSPIPPIPSFTFEGSPHPIPVHPHTHANTSIFDISHCSPPSRRSSTELPLDGQSLSSMLGTLPGLSFNLPLSSRHDNSILPPQNPSLLSSRVPSRSQTPLSISHPTPPLQREPFILPSHHTTPFPSLDPLPSSSHHPSPFPSRRASPIPSRRASPIPSRRALVATDVSQS